MCDRVFALVAKGLIYNDLVNRCQWGTPDLIRKTQLWTMISDPFNEDPMQVYFWKEDAFCQYGSQPTLMTPYLDAFYDQAPMFVNFQQHTKAVRFLKNNTPAGRASALDLEQFEKLKVHA